MQAKHTTKYLVYNQPAINVSSYQEGKFSSLSSSGDEACADLFTLVLNLLCATQVDIMGITHDRE